MTEHVMSREVFDLLAGAAEDRDDSSLRSNYTGRGMWSADTCVALVTDGLSGLVQFAIRVTGLVAQLPPDDAERVAEVVDQLEYGRTREDQLGHSVVYYWPNLAVDGS